MAEVALPETSFEYSLIICRGISIDIIVCRTNVGVLQQAHTQKGEQASVPLFLCVCDVTGFAKLVLKNDWLYAAASAQGAQLNAITTIQINLLQNFTINNFAKYKKI